MSGATPYGYGGTRWHILGESYRVQPAGDIPQFRVALCSSLPRGGWPDMGAGIPHPADVCRRCQVIAKMRSRGTGTGRGQS